MNSAAKKYPSPVTDEADALLSWFSSSGYPMSEKTLRLGGLSYHQFSSFFVTDSGRHCGAYGRSENRRAAAIKCAAELLERKAMIEFFSGSGSSLLPREFHTSNGWAVHFHKHESTRRAYLEALERNLLLKSYLSFGWAGFQIHQKISTPEMELVFLLSRFATKDLVSAMVIAKSPLYSGVSFGYGIGERAGIHSSKFWESALLEAIDRPLILRGEKIDLSHDPKSWLLSESKYFLESDFDFSQLGDSNSELVEIEEPKHQVFAIDLAEKLGLPFSFYSSFAWGGDLIPLFHKRSLQPDGEAYLREILARNGLSDIPERHPVL